MQNFPGTEHDKLCLWPAFVATDTTPSPWLPQVADGRPLRVERCSSPALAAEPHSSAAPHAAANPVDLQTEALRYRQLYQTAVQVKLSHQQHHMHTWDAKHKCHMPLPACQKKMLRTNASTASQKAFVTWLASCAGAMPANFVRVRLDDGMHWVASLIHEITNGCQAPCMHLH